MAETVRVFVPMPDGKPDEGSWPTVLERALEAARFTAKKYGAELLRPWHDSSEWTEQELGGKAMAGWQFTYSTTDPV